MFVFEHWNGVFPETSNSDLDDLKAVVEAQYPLTPKQWMGSDSGFFLSPAQDYILVANPHTPAATVIGHVEVQ